MKTLPSKSASLVPGDTLRALTSDVCDVDGHWWAAGTTYQPVSIGSGPKNGRMQVVSIDGRKVRFALTS